MMSNELFSLLVTQSWQLTLLTLLVWGTLRIFGRDRPHLAHALWVLVLIKCVTPPIWSSPASPFTWLASQSRPIEVSIPQLEPIPASSSPEVAVNLVEPHSVSTEPADVIFSRDEYASRPVEFERSEVEKSEEKSLTRFVPDHPQWPSAPYWTASLIAIWLAGFTLVLAMTIGKSVAFLLWLRQSKQVDDPELNQTLARLARKLKIRRHVRLRVLENPVGPAVLGLIRPTILLPNAVISGKTQKQLEPLLAHELVHIRRGDLAWSIVQTVAKSLFWFHPLVLMAVAMVTRESERSCDEETVASLGCKPAAYARGLLEVLEHKHRLRVAPALPGIRPVDITSARLERVMNLGQGSYRRTPIWVWFVLVVCGAIVLPGAAMMVAQEDGVDRNLASENTESGRLERLPQYFSSTPGKTLTRLPTALNDQRLPSISVQLVPQDSQAADDNKWMLKSFDVGTILDRIREANLNTITPEHRLILEFPCRYPGEKGTSTPQGRDIRFLTDDGEIHLGGQAQTIKIVGDQLHVFDTKTVIHAVEEKLNLLNEHRFNNIVVECRFGSIPRKKLDQLGIEWSIGHSAASQLTTPSGNVTDASANLTYIDVDQISPNFSRDQERTNSQVRAASYVEKSSPVLFALIDDEEFDKLQNDFRGDVKSNLMQAPSVTMFSGSDAQVTSGATRPFVVGLDLVQDPDGKLPGKLQPVIRLVPDGSTVNLNAQVNEDESIDLQCHVSFSKVISVDTAEVPVKVDDGKARVQIPEVSTNQIQSSMNIPKGKTLVLGSFHQGDKGQKEVLLTVLKCRSFVHVPDTPYVLMSPEKISQSEVISIINSQGVSRTSGSVEAQSNSFGGRDASDKSNTPVIGSSTGNPVLSKPAQTADQIQSSSPIAQFTLRSDRNSKGSTNYQPLIEIFENRQMDLKVEGQVDFEIDGDRVRLKGENLSFGLDPQEQDDDSGWRISGDRGMIESSIDSDSEFFIIQFEGNVKLQLHGSKMSADKIVFGSREDNPRLELMGNAVAASDGVDMRAQNISYIMGNNTDSVLTGNARLIRSEPKTDIQANQIRWNRETGEIKVSNMNTTSTKK